MRFDSMTPAEADAIARLRDLLGVTAPEVYTLLVTLRDGYVVTVPNVRFDAIAVEGEGARANLCVETTADRIIRIPMSTVAYYEADVND